MNIEKAKECCEEVVKMKNETDFTVNNYILGLAIETVLSELEKQKDNYKMLSESVSSIAKELNLEEDATIDEIYVAIRLLKSKRVNMFEQLECIEKKNKIIDEMAKNMFEFRKDSIIPIDAEGIKQYFEKKVEEQI